MADFILVTTQDDTQLALCVANVITVEPIGTDPEISPGSNVLMREGRQLHVQETVNEITGVTLKTKEEVEEAKKERADKIAEVLAEREEAAEEAKKEASTETKTARYA